MAAPMSSTSASKRPADSQIPAEESDQLIIKPLGSGQEVGRSCIFIQYKGKKIVLDCGIHPGKVGLESLPFLDEIEPTDIDLLLVSHFHLDHCGGLPFFLQKTTFKGRTFMTHATKAIYRWLLSDYIKVSNISAEDMLYTEDDLDRSMGKIETINFHQEIEVDGVKFWCYNAGHVLGAAMFMIEIAGIKILYTGDFSRQEDRHLMAAEIPNIHPDVLITESTYGTHIHEKREDREGRFTGTVHDIINRGGRCLIPVFALGRAQELLLILDEYWSNHPELHEIPIYYASSLAKKCMSVYQTYVNAMNEKIRRQISISNPFVFKHISYLRGMEHFDDVGPSVVMASPGMMQSGLSRELFENWCTDPKNGTIIAGYCVEGTLAKHILTEPEDIQTMSGQKIPLKASVDYISFSAHTDYQQTSEFIRFLKPPHIVLVHGEQNEMSRLAAAIKREYEDSRESKINVYTPKNTQAVELYFHGEKMAKVMGRIAATRPTHGAKLSGVLIKRNFNYHLMSPADIPNYTDMKTSSVTQRQSIPFTGPFSLLHHYLLQLAGTVEQIRIDEQPAIKIFKHITITYEPGVVILEWQSSAVNDMYADAALAVILRVEADPQSHRGMRTVPKNTPDALSDEIHTLLCHMFSEKNVDRSEKGDHVSVTVGGKIAIVNVRTGGVTCKDDDLNKMVSTAVCRLNNSLKPFD